MNFFYANGTPIINSLKVTSEVPLDPRLTVENIAERDSLVTNHISYDRMKVYVKSNDTKYIYHKDTGEWEIDNKFSEEDKSKLDRIDNYLIDTEYIYNPENKLLYREHSYDPNTDITTLRDHILQEARVSENGELYNGLLSKFYVNRLNNITNYLIDVSFTKGTDVPNLYLTTHSYNPDEDKTTLTNIDIPLATDDNHGLLSNLQNIKVNRIVDYVNRIDTTHTNAPDTGLTYNYNIYNPFTNANVTKTILIPLVTHTENGLTSSSDKIKIDDIETYVKSIALRQASGTEELGINYIITNPNDQTDTPGYFNIPLVTDSRNGLVSPARKHWMDNASGVSNTGTTSDTWQLDKKDIDTRLDPNGGVIIKDSGGVAEIRNSTDSAYSDLTLNNITIKGDVTQEGRSFITEAETVEVRDNTLLLNRGETGAGVSKEFAGIEIDRGSEPKYQILFDESDDRFKVGKEGDLWCVTLRDDEADMVNGMFTSWDSSTKRLKTTNIVPSSSLLYFGDNKKVALSYNNSEGLSIYNGNNALAIFPTANNTTFRCTGNNFQLVGKLITLNETISSTFKRVSDNSEVLYHADIVNNLTSGGTNKVLSAEQGKLLQNSITSIQGSYLPLSGGTMTGSIIFPNRKGIFGTLTNGTSNIKIAVVNANNNVEIGNSNTPLMLVSNSTDLTHYRDNNTYEIWDKFNLSDPATSTDLANYLPLIGGTLTGQLTIKQSVDIKLRLQSTDADNHCIIQAINAQASQLGVFGYAGDKWAIGHNGTYYEIWDKYNLTNPVTYTTDTYNYATLRNKDGQYFTYIKAGTNGLLPHSQATLANGGAGLLGTSDWSFNSAYINHVHTNKITFGGTGPYITGSTSATQFLNANGGVQKVATGGLYVGPSYASDALNLVPANGIYSRGIIYIENGIGFRSSIWTNDLTPNRNYSGYLQVLDAYDASGAGGPTNYGTVLQVNSRHVHWANQLWFSGGAEASKKGLYYRHMAYNQTEYGEWNRLLTNKDVNIIQTQSSSNPSTLPVNQIFYSEIKGVAGTPTTNGSLFSVQGDDEGIQLWASSSRTELYYRTKWTSFGNWIKLATTSDIGNYLPLTGGTLSGNLAINTVGSTTLVINNNDTNGSETFMRVLRKGTASAAIGFRDSLGAYIYNYNSNKYLFIDNDGYARVGTTSSSTRLALITDISTVSGYLPLSGGTMTGALTMDNRKNNAVIDVVGGTGNNWNGGAGALSVQVPGDGGQTPLLVARRSGAAIDTTTAAERLLSMELLNTGNTFRITLSNTSTFQLDLSTAKGFLFGKTIATTDQIPSIPSISISNSGSGNAVTSITANGHTLTVTKGATYLTSSALSGYATQSWANSQFAPLTNFTLTSNYATIKGNGNEICIGNTSQSSASAYMLINYRVPTGCTYAPNAFYFRAGSAESWANIYAGNVYMSSNLVATQTWSSGQFPTKTGTGASGTWGISISGNAATATTATKWNGYSIWTGTEDELPSSRDANTLYFVKKSS